MFSRCLPLLCVATLALPVWAVGFRTGQSERAIGLREELIFTAPEAEDGLPEAPRALDEATGGVYSGLVRIGVDHAYLRVQINRAGALTGVLFIEGRRVVLSSVDDGAGTFDFADLGEVPDMDDPSQTLPLSLELQRDEKVTKLTGTLTAGEFSNDFTLRRKPADNDAGGSYSMILPVPQFDSRRPLTLGGNGYARMIVAANGYVRIFGELATGQVFSAGAYVQGKAATPGDGDTETAPGVTIEMMVLLNPQDPAGTFSGTLQFVAGDKNADVRSNFLWRFPGRERDGGFRPGLRLYQPVLGSVFTVLDSSDAPIQTPEKSPENVRVKLSGFGLSDGITDLGNSRTGTIDSRSFDLDIQFDPDTGIYAGTCRHPANDRLVRTRGIVFQKTNEVYGLFLFGPGSGAVQVFGK